MAVAVKTYFESHNKIMKHFMFHNPLISYVLTLPILVYFAFSAVQSTGAWVEYAAGAILGLLYWSFFEYSMHRWLYHSVFRWRWMNAFWQSFHIYHHRNIEDTRVLNVGLLFFLPMIVVNLGLIYLLSLGIETVFFSAATITLAYYLFYEYVHYSIHQSPEANAYIRWITKYHLYHHHKDARTNFGNTVVYWDKLFGTYAPQYKEWSKG